MNTPVSDTRHEKDLDKVTKVIELNYARKAKINLAGKLGGVFAWKPLSLNSIKNSLNQEKTSIMIAW